MLIYHLVERCFRVSDLSKAENQGVEKVKIYKKKSQHIQIPKKEKQRKGSRSLASFIACLFMQHSNLSLHGFYNLSETRFLNSIYCNENKV